MKSRPTFFGLHRIAFIAAALGCGLCVVSSQAQITVSNLSQTNSGSGAPAAFTWDAQSFTTDATAASYNLSSVTLDMGTALNTSGNFFVALYSDSGGLPGSSLEMLSGTANPATVGNYSFTSSGTILNQNTTYWIVAGVSSGSGQYAWNTTTSTSETSSGASWTLGNLAQFTEGAGPPFVSTFGPLKMSVTATVPEPATYAAIAGVAMLGLALWRRRRVD